MHRLSRCWKFTRCIFVYPMMRICSRWSRLPAMYRHGVILRKNMKTCRSRYGQNVPPRIGLLRPVSGVIYALTLSPQAVIERYEHHTPSLKQRLDFASKLIDSGCAVRLCFDPMIYLPDWEQEYARLFQQVCDVIDMDGVVDVSVGTFRISQDYLKKMRKQEPNCALVWFPFQNENGYYHYPKQLMEQMETFLVDRFSQILPKEKIFRWKE